MKSRSKERPMNLTDYENIGLFMIPENPRETGGLEVAQNINTNAVKPPEEEILSKKTSSVE